ncbi:VapE domain-containing protein [Nodularia sphaerocarpa]|nr:VapE domain-containing protein [Nodularia sphaerocarpa]ULP74166.1 hypothetical protein BDGGKGIB_03829 [Nodularia sphaerocarpa UHCC 0038]
METAPLFLQNGESYYWQQILNRQSEKIIITEGAKKAAAGLSAGYPTISIPGVSTCRKNGRLHPMLEAFAVLGRTFYLCFDNDILVKRPVQVALIGLAAKLAKSGSNIMIIELPPGPAKGMDDFIAANGSTAFEKLVEEAATFEEWKSSLEDSDLEEEKPKSKIARNFEMISEAWGESLRYNSLKKDVEFNGMPLQAEHLRLMVGLQFPVDISKDDAFTIIEFLAKKQKYSPICDYLDEVEAKYPGIDTSFLDELAAKFFGTNDPLHAKYFKNFLVASVARARVPGCWMDCALLLVGKQGIRKSTFWRTLYGDDFFSDDLGDGSDKDERMKMHRFWCLEWSEFENVYRRKDLNQLKAFLARRYETYRTPYDRLPHDHKRGCVFVGTTNESEVLNDPTGNRRFWIIPCSGTIPVDDVMQMRDRIWAAANALFKAGYQYRLDDKEELRREEQNEEYQVSHPWSDILDEYVKYKEYVTVQDCFKQLNIDPLHQNPANQRQIINLLKKIGLENDRVKIDGRWSRIWRKKSDVLNNDLSAGSAGSDEKIQADMPTQQGIQPFPVEKSLPDQVLEYTLPKVDPLEEKIDITVSQSRSKDSSTSDPADPAIHRENIPQDETEYEQQSTETALADKFACPQRDSYYSGFDVKPLILKIDTNFGDAEITATPYKKRGQTHWLHCIVSFLDGSRDVAQVKVINTQPLTIKTELHKNKVIKDWADSQRLLWRERVGEEFRVRKRNSDIHSDEDYYYETGRLVNVPNPPLSHFFMFKTSKGKVFTSNFEDIQ